MRFAGLLLLLVCRWLPAEQPPFRLFTTEDGLVRNWIQRIRTDSRGNLWFCTIEGISIFDGSQFTNFTVRDGLPNRLINDLLETSAGEYWIATGNGISRFHPVARPPAGHFENFAVTSGADANRVLSIAEDSQHRLWLATEGGLFVGHLQGNAMAFRNVPLGPGSQRPVSTVLEDPRGRIWAGSNDGVSVVATDGQVTHLGKSQGVPLVVSTMLLDRDTLWIGGEGLLGLDVTSERYAVTARYRDLNGDRHRILSMHRSPQSGDLWIGVAGLLRFSPDAAPQDRFQPFPTSPVLAQYDVMAIGSDSASNLWVGVSTLGAVRVLNHPSDSFSTADGLESSSVIGILEDRKGKLYAITGARHTLNELSGGRFLPRPRRDPPGIEDMGWGQGPVALQDRHGEWWIASAHGLLHYPATDDARKLAFIEPRVETRRDGLPDDVILRLFEDSRGDLWAGTSAGLAKRTAADARWIAFPAVRDPVHSIAEDRSGAVWAGFASQRLLRVRGAIAEVISDHLPPAFVNALLPDRQGRLWIGTSQGGLARIDDPAAEHPILHPLPVSGLSSDQIFSLVEDALGRIYIAGGRGVDRLDPETGAIRHLTSATLLPPGETERLYRDRSGSIWFASNFGLARYRPGPDEPSPTPAPLLRRLTIAGEEYPLSILGERTISGLQLAPRQANIEVEYRAVHLSSAERLRYQYRLRGASERWSDPSALQTVRFANLGAGSYTFEVRSVMEDGAAGEPAVLQFHLLAPVWRRGWFLGAAFSLAIAAAFLLHRYRLQQALVVERVRTRLATDLHDDLGAGLAEIAIMSEVGRRSPGGAEDMLDQVARRARGLRSTLGDIVWTVDPRKDRFPDLVRRMRETAFTMLETENRRVHFLAPPDGQFDDLAVAADLRRHLMLFFKEAVTNVARHAAAREVTLRLSADRAELRLSIHDDGRGFNTSCPPEGRGLNSLRYRAAEIRGRVQIESSPGRGTGIDLCVPLRK